MSSICDLIDLGPFESSFCSPKLASLCVRLYVTFMFGDLLFEGGLKVGLIAALNSTLFISVCKCVVVFAFSSGEWSYFGQSGVSGELIDIDALLVGLTV